MTQDLNYYASNYFTPDHGYLVYTADAEAQVASASTLTASVSVIKNASATLTVTATQTSMISDIRGVDMFAFSSATMDIQVQRLRDNNINASSVFTISTSGNRIRYISAEEDASFNLDIANLRVRNDQAALDAAFSLAADNEVILGTSIGLTSAFTVVAIGETLSRTIEVSADLFATTSISASGGLLQEGVIECDALFTPGLTVDVFKNSFAVLESTASVSAQVDRLGDLRSQLNSTASVSAQVDRIRSSAIGLTSNATVSLVPTVFRGVTSGLTSQATVAVQAIKYRAFAAGLQSTATVTADPQVTKFFSNLTWISSKGGSGTYNTTYRMPSGSGSGVQLAKETVSSPAGEYLTTSGNAYSVYKLNFANNTDWTIEFFAWSLGTVINSGTGIQALMLAYDASANNPIAIYMQGNGAGGATSKVQLTDAAATSYTLTHTTTGTISTTARHYAVVKSGTNLYYYINGVRTSGSTSTLGTMAAITSLQLGGPAQTSSGGDFVFDEVRVSNSARYTSTSFTPPTTAFTRDTNTIVLSHFDSSLAIDNGLVTGSGAWTSTAALNATTHIFGTITATANLTSTAVVNAVPTTIRSAQAALLASGSEVIVIGKIIPEFAGLDAAFSLSVTPAKVKNAQAALASNFSLSAVERTLVLASGALSSAFTLVAVPREILGDYQKTSTVEALVHFETTTPVDVMHSGPPHVYAGTPTITTGKFNNALVLGGNNGYFTETTSIYLDYAAGFPDYNYEVWYKAISDAPGYGYGDTTIVQLQGGVDADDAQNPHININLYDTQFHSTTGNLWGLSDRQLYVQWGRGNSIAPPSGQVSSFIVNLGVWNHFLISRHNGTEYRLFINGTLTLTWSVSPTAVNNPTTALAGINSALLGAYDELRLRKTAAITSNFTVPTSAYPESEGYMRQGLLDASTTATVVANVMKVKEFQGAWTSTFTQNTTGLRLKLFQVALSSQFQESVTGKRSASLVSNDQVTATLVSPINRLLTSPVALTSRATMTTSAMKAVVSAGDLTSAFTLIASGKRYRGISTNLQSAFAQAANARKSAVAVSNLTAFATTVEIVNKVGRGFIHMDSRATVNAQVRVIRDQPIGLQATAQLHAVGYNTQFGSSSLQAQASLALQATYLRHTEALLVARATVQASIGRIRRTPAALQATVNLQATIKRTRNNPAALISQATLVINNQIIRLASANLQVQTELLATPFKLLIAEAHLVCEGFELVTGDVINIDPYRQLTIVREHRGLLIYEESRKLAVKSETRVNKIRGIKR